MVFPLLVTVTGRVAELTLVCTEATAPLILPALRFAQSHELSVLLLHQLSVRVLHPSTRSEPEHAPVPVELAGRRDHS
jgi:hypothetical protein